MARPFLTPIVLPGDPTAALEAATKQYVDAEAGRVDHVGATAPAGPLHGALWVDTDEGQEILHSPPAPPEDTGWLALNPINGWEPYGGAWPANTWSPRYRKREGVVYLEGLVRDMGAVTSTQFFLLPVGYRPADNTMRAAQTSGGGQCRYDIGSNGSCNLYLNQSDASAAASWINIGRSLIVD